MRTSLFAIFIAAVLASCSTSYSIKGTSDMPMLDGHKLYLQAVKGNEIKNIDSCEVVHGKFEFHGLIDSVKVASVYLNEASSIPVVLEEGDIEVTINSASQNCSGTPLNDKLSEFINKYKQIINEMSDLERKPYQALMDGEELSELQPKWVEKRLKLDKDLDELYTSFIEENFDNVLAPYIFLDAVSSMENPVPWAEALLMKATDNFKNNKFVQEFIKAMEHRNDIMGTAPDAEQPLDAAPTPNQMAAPMQSDAEAQAPNENAVPQE